MAAASSQTGSLRAAPQEWQRPAGEVLARAHRKLARCVQYHKNGSGQLVKCWHERIAEDFTNKDLKCPNCGRQFARETMVRGLPANKIIGGKVFVKR